MHITLPPLRLHCTGWKIKPSAFTAPPLLSMADVITFGPPPVVETNSISLSSSSSIAYVFAVFPAVALITFAVSVSKTLTDSLILSPKGVIVPAIRACTPAIFPNFLAV
jgi:hypothetical protein